MSRVHGCDERELVGDMLDAVAVEGGTPSISPALGMVRLANDVLAACALTLAPILQPVDQAGRVRRAVSRVAPIPLVRDHAADRLRDPKEWVE